MNARPRSQRPPRTAPCPPLAALVIALALATAAFPPAAVAAAPHHPVSLQLLHPLGTSPDPATTSDVRLSLLWGRGGAVSWLDAGLVATTTGGDVRGLQGVGLYAGVDGDLRGLGFTAGLHRVGGDVRGVQFASGASWTTGRVAGVQYGTLLSYAGGELEGAQLSGLVNLDDGDGRWAQLASVANVAGGAFTGAQLTSLFNYTAGEIQGVQAAALNFAGRVRGAQLGAINVAREASGLQVGVVNVVDRHHGLPVGLVNLDRDGPRDVLVYATSVALANAGYRTEVGGWRSTIAAGWYEVDADHARAGALSWHFGRRLAGDARQNLGLDAGLVHLIPEQAGEPGGGRLHPSLQVRLTGDRMIGRRWGLHGAVGLAITGDSYDDGADGESELLLAGGVVWR